MHRGDFVEEIQYPEDPPRQVVHQNETTANDEDVLHEVDKLAKELEYLDMDYGKRDEKPKQGKNLVKKLLSTGKVTKMVEKAVAKAAHRFLGVDKETGRILGAIAGNVMFRLGGKHNSLGGIGKVVLDNMVTGQYKRDVDHYSRLDFLTERDRCLRERRLFEDPEFPANDRSLYFRERPNRSIIWKRPAEIVRDPQLIVEGHSRFDVKQGKLGDCWLLAAVANLTLRDELFYRVVPPDQSFTENYAGIFHFQFWRYGKWVDVVIDDRLPTVDGKLYYMHSADNREFWSALLEKAYAKMYGSYEHLDGGFTTEALEDFTGGLSETLDLRNLTKDEVFDILVKGFHMKSLFAASIKADAVTFEAKLPNGLVCGHAYSITALETVNTTHGRCVLLRLRNPWGNETEWKGAYSDGSLAWSDVSALDRRSLHLEFAQDGEFWMSLHDFKREFERLEVCNLPEGVMNEIALMTGIQKEWGEAAWAEVAEHGAWSDREGTAGGCPNREVSFSKNPQYLVTVERDNRSMDGKATLIVSLLQKYRREMKNKGAVTLPIGLTIFHVPRGTNSRVDGVFIGQNRPLNHVNHYTNQRQVSVRTRVDPGDYIIIPSTYDPHCDADFLLRMFSNGHLRSRLLK